VTPCIVIFIQPAKTDKTGNISSSTISVSIRVNNTQEKINMEDKERDDWPEKEIFAILGGVLGFWGGVWCLGIIFLMVLMAQRVVCRKGEERKKVL